MLIRLPKYFVLASQNTTGRKEQWCFPRKEKEQAGMVAPRHDVQESWTWPPMGSQINLYVIRKGFATVDRS